MKAFGACVYLDKISLSHRGSPNDRVMIKWLEMLNEYGTIP